MLKVVPAPPAFKANPDLLRCAVTSAYEFSDSMSGAQRDLTLSIMHLTEMAKTMVDLTLDSMATD